MNSTPLLNFCRVYSNIFISASSKLVLFYITIIQHPILHYTKTNIKEFLEMCTSFNLCKILKRSKTFPIKILLIRHFLNGRIFDIHFLSFVLIVFYYSLNSFILTNIKKKLNSLIIQILIVYKIIRKKIILFKTLIHLIISIQ